MHITKMVLISAAIVILLAGILTGTGFLLLTQSTDMEERMRIVETNKGVEQSFDIKLQTLEEEIKAAIDTGESKEVKLILTEEEVSIVLVKMMQAAMNDSADAASENMVMETIVNLDENGIRAIVDMEMYGVKVSAGAYLQASANERGISLQLDELEIGQLSFIDPIKDRIKESFNESHENMNLDDLHIDLEKDLPVKLKDLIISEGEMVITGVVT